MSKIIDELNNLDIQVKEKIDLTDGIKIYGLYENGEYNSYLNELTSFIVDNEYISIHSLFLGLNAEIILELYGEKNVSKVLEDYCVFIKNKFSLLSPSDIHQKEKLCINSVKGLIETLATNLQHVQSISKSVISINATAVLYILNDLLDFLDNYNIKIKEDLDVVSQLKIIKAQETKEKETKEKETKEKETKEKETKEKETKEENVSHISKDNKFISQNSYKWDMLIARIDTLKQLISDEKIYEAAIVYEDIESRLNQFDLKEYFPKIFFPLYKKLAPVATKIYRAREEFSNTIPWKIAKEMYNTDFKSFLLEIDAMPENKIIENFDQYQSTQEQSQPSYSDEIADDDPLSL